MVGRGGEVEEVLGSSATVLRLLGLWSPREHGGRAAGYLVLALLFVTTAMPVLKLLMDRPRELEELGACMFDALMLCDIFSKMVCFFVQGPTLRQLVQMLSEIRSQDRTNKGNDEIRLRYHRLGERMFLLIMGLAIVTDAMWSATPVMQQWLSRDGDSPRLLPLPAWLPLDMYASPTYQVLYVAQVLLIPLSTTSVCSDFVFIGLMLRISAELEILNDSISSLRKIRKGVSPTSKNEAKSIDTVLDDEINLRFSRNVKHHQAILKSVALLEEAMSTAIFILFLGTMIAISINIFAAMAVLQTVGGMTKALKMVTAIPPILFEVGLYCIFGQIVTDQSEKLMHSAYSCGWVDCNTRFRRSLLTFCVGTRRPLEITVGAVSKLSKETFLQVLNGSYAMFNVLYGFQSNR